MSGRLQQAGHHVEEVVGEPDELGQHPVAAEHEHQPDPDELGHEGQRDLLDLRHRLEQRHDQPDGQAHDEDRGAELGADDHRLHGDLDDVGVHQAKLLSRERTMRPHPSTMTKRRSLNGRETNTGGSIIIPMDMSELETTMSITRKGMKTTKPMMKAVFNSERMKAGMRAARPTSSGFSGRCPPLAAELNMASSPLRVCLSMKVRSGPTAES